MDSTLSVSKGCFAFIPSRNTRKSEKYEIDDFAPITTQPWYLAYKQLSDILKFKLEKLNKDISKNLVQDVITFISKCDCNDRTIHAVALFTGINLPDHETLFTVLSTRLKKKAGCYVTILSPSSSTAVKSVVTNMVSGFMHGDATKVLDTENSCDEEDLGVEKRKKSHCNLPTLVNWYKETHYQNGKFQKDLPLVVIIPDIEGYNSKTLQDFLLILSAYKEQLPLILVFGVATTLSTIHNTLSYNILSKLTIHLFKSQPSVVFLNSMLEKVFLTSDCPFQLGGKVFQFLTDMFLFYNFSVTRFMRGIQFCLMNHFFCSDLSMLCTIPPKRTKAVNSLTNSHLKEICQLPSMKLHLEGMNEIDRSQFADDVRLEVEALIYNFYEHMARFHCGVRCLYALVNDLPKIPLGKHLREIYTESMSVYVVETIKFRACFEILGFSQKEELEEKLKSIIAILKENAKDNVCCEVIEKLNGLRDNLKTAGTERIPQNSSIDSVEKLDLNVKSRSQLRQKLFDNARQEKILSEFEKVRKQILDTLVSDLFKPFLKPPTTLPLHELFIYNKTEVLRAHIAGNYRASIHTALTNPQHYLQCKCCFLEEHNEILRSMPDICITYKLHLECGTLINLYDWLQSYVAVISVEDGSDTPTHTNDISLEIQNRFSRAVEELQLLGFIKKSSKKIDHVERLTFEGI